MIIISPSKNLDLKEEEFPIKSSSPTFLSNSKAISSKIKDLDVDKIKSLMKISESLAGLNFLRFQNINKPKNIKKPAGYMFSGGTFEGLSIRSMNNSQLSNAQKSLRILSGLYGVLKPFDLIEPYRLEMGTDTFKILGQDLYSYWKPNVTNKLKSELKLEKSKFLYNLASKEYASVIDFNQLGFEVINFDFKKKVKNNLTGIGMMIKKLRGAMANFIISKNINDLDGLKKFSEYGFNYSGFDDKRNQLIFITK